MSRYLEYQDWRAEQRQGIFGDCDNHDLVLDDGKEDDPDYEPPLEIRRSSDSDPAELVSEDDREEEFSGFEADDDDDQGKKRGESAGKSVGERDAAGVIVGGSAGVGEGGSEVRGRCSPKDRKGKVKGKKSAPSDTRPVGENDGEGEVSAGVGGVNLVLGVGGGVQCGEGAAQVYHVHRKRRRRRRLFLRRLLLTVMLGGGGLCVLVVVVVVRVCLSAHARPTVMADVVQHAAVVTRCHRGMRRGSLIVNGGTDPTPPIEIPFTAIPGLRVPTPTTPLGFLQLFSVELQRFLQEETNVLERLRLQPFRLTRVLRHTP